MQTLESQGLGEGWSDALAEYVDCEMLPDAFPLTVNRNLHRWTEWTSAAVTDYVTGVYVTGNPAGIRTYPYSTNA